MIASQPSHMIDGPGGPNRWDPKGLRERLAKQEMYAPDKFTKDLITRLVMAVDKHRPLDQGGNHRELHTDTCGCE